MFGLLCLSWAASASIFILRAGFAAGAKNSKQTCLGDQRRPLKRGIRPSSLLREVETALREADARLLIALRDGARPARPPQVPYPRYSQCGPSPEKRREAETPPRRRYRSEFTDTSSCERERARLI